MRKKAIIIGILGVLLLIQHLSAQTWEKAKRLTWNNGNSQSPAIALDSSNNIHIVWYDETTGDAEIFFKKSTNGGTTWSSSKRLTWNSGSSYVPSIAIDSSDNTHIAWKDYSPGNGEIFYKKSSDGGTTWSNSKRLTWTADISYNPAIATDSSDNIHIVWHDSENGNYEIYYLKSTDGGATWTTKRLTWNSGNSGYTDIATDSSDHVHVVWDDWTPGNREIFYKKSTDGGSTWAFTKRLTWKLFNSYKSAISTDSDNYIHVVWQDWDSNNYEIHYKKSTNGGLTWFTKRLTWNSGSSWFADIDADPNNNIHVVFYDDSPGNDEIFYRRSTDRGTSWTTKRHTWNYGNSKHPAIITDSNNHIHVVWEDNTPGNFEIYYKKGTQ
jgi:hypothetical protein